MKRLIAAASLCVIAFLAQAGRAAIDIQFDYTYDDPATGFFSGTNAWRRPLLDAAASVFESRLSLENFGGITPGGGNSWSLTIQRGGTGYPWVTLTNPVIAADTVTIYVGGRYLPSSSTLAASYFSYSYSGDAAWTDMFQARDSTTNFDSFGGSIWFNSNSSLVPWYFDSDPSTLEDFAGEYDFFSVAEHEIMHILGFNDAAHAFAAQISGTTFAGSNVETLYGGPAPLASASDLDHWSQAMDWDGQHTIMQPVFYWNERKAVTDLDFAVLKDIGYTVSAVPEPEASALIVVFLAPIFLRRRAARRRAR
jgi:hypothetical protein